MNLDISLLEWQKEVWNDPTRFKVVAAGRRTGKSRLAAYLLIVNALKVRQGAGLLCSPHTRPSTGYYVESPLGDRSTRHRELPCQQHAGKTYQWHNYQLEGR